MLFESPLMKAIREQREKKERDNRLLQSILSNSNLPTPPRTILGRPLTPPKPILGRPFNIFSNALQQSVKRKVFISYHHENDQSYKEELLRINEQNKLFVDISVDTGDIDDNLSDDRIREIIRDDYLRDSTVTILLVGLETKGRKHIDWELYSSMYDGVVNKKSGILVINLPSINNTYFTTSHEGEKKRVYPENTSWMSIDNRSEYERRYPYMPFRIIDNLLKKDAKISVVPWEKIETDPSILSFLIGATYNDRTNCNYDLSSLMKRANS